MSKDPKERIKELEDLARERYMGKDGINVADYLTTDEYEELLELEEKLEEEEKKKKSTKGYVGEVMGVPIENVGEISGVPIENVASRTGVPIKHEDLEEEVEEEEE